MLVELCWDAMKSLIEIFENVIRGKTFFETFQDVIQETNPETQEAQIDGESRSTVEKRILHYTIHQHI